MSDTSQVDKLTRVYIKIRDKRAELSKRFNDEDGALKEQLDKIKGALLDYCKEQGVESVRTSEGMFYRTTRVRYWTSDWESMNKFILDHGLPEFYEKRLNQGAVKEFLEENPDTVPPGLNSNTEYTLTVRKK